MNKQFFENILPGTNLFGKFRLLRCLSAVDTCAVYLCEHIDGPLVALKVISNKIDPQSQFRAQFLRELDISRSVDHPNVIRIYESFEDSDFIAYSMEYLMGGNLAERIRSSELPSVSKGITWLRQIASGLTAIHRKRIIHRDLKPENIMFGESETLKIVDFGISLQYGMADEVPGGSLMGTVNYLSPEYIRDGSCDFRSDVYAWGVIAYHVLTGRLPFQGENLIDTLTRRVTHDPLSPHKIRGDIPHLISEIILKALQRNPEHRIQSADEICVRLDEYIGLSKRIEGFHRANHDSRLMKKRALRAIA